MSTTWPTTAPPLTATSRAPTAPAGWPGCALSAFCFTVLVSSSIEEAVSSSELACSSVRCDRSALPAAIWPEAVAMRVGAMAHLGHDPDQAGLHGAQGGQQVRDLVLAIYPNGAAQVALGHRVGGIDRQLERAGNATDQCQAEQCRKHDAGQHGSDEHRASGFRTARRRPRIPSWRRRSAGLSVRGANRSPGCTADGPSRSRPPLPRTGRRAPAPRRWAGAPPGSAWHAGP